VVCVGGLSAYRSGLRASLGFLWLLAGIPSGGLDEARKDFALAYLK